MDQDENKKQNNVNMNFDLRLGMEITSSQMRIIYEKYLNPLKSRIEKLAIIDTNLVNELMQEFNNIIGSDDKNLKNILTKITILEGKVTNYENVNKDKMQYIEISKKIEQLMSSQNVLEFEEFYKLFEDIRNQFPSIKFETFKDMINLRRDFFELMIIFIIRLHSEKGLSSDESLNLKNLISEKDANEVRDALIARIDSYLQDSEKEEMISKIKDLLKTYPNAVYSKNLWDLIIELETGRSHLTLAQNRNSVETNKLVSVRDVEAISIDSLIKMSTPEIIDEDERRLLEKANRKNIKTVYPRTAKFMVYDRLDTLRSSSNLAYEYAVFLDSILGLGLSKLVEKELKRNSKGGKYCRAVRKLYKSHIKKVDVEKTKDDYLPEERRAREEFYKGYSFLIFNKIDDSQIEERKEGIYFDREDVFTEIEEHELIKRFLDAGVNPELLKLPAIRERIKNIKGKIMTLNIVTNEDGTFSYVCHFAEINKHPDISNRSITTDEKVKIYQRDGKIHLLVDRARSGENDTILPGITEDFSVMDHEDIVLDEYGLEAGRIKTTTSQYGYNGNPTQKKIHYHREDGLITIEEGESVKTCIDCGDWNLDESVNFSQYSISRIIHDYCERETKLMEEYPKLKAYYKKYRETLFYAIERMLKKSRDIEQKKMVTERESDDGR